MTSLNRIASTVFDSAKRRIAKLVRFSAVQTAVEISPYGTDSNPIKNMVAVYMETAGIEKDVIVGYVNVNQLADVGEHRIYSTDAEGNLKTFIWLTKDGKIKLGGDADNSVRYSPLNSGLQDLVNQLQAELVKIQTGIIAGGGTYTPRTLSLDIDASKIDEIETL